MGTVTALPVVREFRPGCLVLCRDGRCLSARLALSRYEDASWSIVVGEGHDRWIYAPAGQSADWLLRSLIAALEQAQENQ